MKECFCCCCCCYVFFRESQHWINWSRNLSEQRRKRNEQPAKITKPQLSFVSVSTLKLLCSNFLWVWKQILPRAKSWGHVRHYLQFILVILSGDCDFESGMCTYDNTQTEDQFDWLRNAGATPSWRTGPSVDHTLGTGFGNSVIRIPCFCLISTGNSKELNHQSAIFLWS